MVITLGTNASPDMILTAFDRQIHEKKYEIPPEACRPSKKLNKKQCRKSGSKKVETKQCRKSGFIDSYIPSYTFIYFHIPPTSFIHLHKPSHASKY